MKCRDDPPIPMVVLLSHLACPGLTLQAERPKVLVMGTTITLWTRCHIWVWHWCLTVHPIGTHGAAPHAHLPLSAGLFCAAKYKEVKLHHHHYLLVSVRWQALDPNKGVTELCDIGRSFNVTKCPMKVYV